MAEILDFNQKKWEKESEGLKADVETADQIVKDMIDDVDDLLHTYGMSERNSSISKDIYYVMESLRSLVYGYMGLEHPLHDIVDRYVDSRYDEEEDIYYVKWADQSDIEQSIDDLVDNLTDIE